MEAKQSHWGDRTLNRTLDRTRLTRPVSSSHIQRARAPARRVGHGTGASGQVQEMLRNTQGRLDAVAHPITPERTRQVASGCLLESAEL
jgi:hypothetical protein